MNAIIVVLFTIFCVNVYGQQRDENRIDSELETCLEQSSSQTTVGMVACFVEAEKKWNKELNFQLQQLRKSLSPEQQIKLEKAQSDWEKFRESEIAFLKQYYTEMQGTIWNISLSKSKMELSKNRSIELSSYSSYISDER